MNRITFFTGANCTLCRAALHVIDKVRRQTDFELDIVDISAPGNEQLSKAYHDEIPVIHLNGNEIFRRGVNEQRLRSLLQS